MNLRALYAAGMADALKMDASELYDWERSIREDGQFSGSRSGPGGGTPATPENVALLLLAILVSPTKRNAGRRATVTAIGACYIAPGGDRFNDMLDKACPLTGQKSIGDALAVLLALPRKTDRIEVDPHEGTVKIWESFEHEDKVFTPCHLFVTPSPTKDEEPIRNIRILSGNALRTIAKILSNGSDEEDE